MEKPRLKFPKFYLIKATRSTFTRGCHSASPILRRDSFDLFTQDRDLCKNDLITFNTEGKKLRVSTVLIKEMTGNKIYSVSIM